MGFFDKAKLQKSGMAGKWGVPPFSVLDGRSGDWTQRKKRWLNLGLQGELGRLPSDDDKLNVAFRKTLNQHGRMLRGHYERKATKKNLEGLVDPEKLAVLDEKPDWQEKDTDRTGVSVFDPVLTELMYRWFNLPGGGILDPFAGGSTRGVVAEVLGYKYTGVEIRQDQIDANKKQANSIDVHPNWVQGDSYLLDQVLPQGEQYDMVFSSPPYYDREIYSSNKADGSVHASYSEFTAWYIQIICQCMMRLKENRFAVFVIGEIRDQKTGVYQGFVPDTITCFEDCGGLYFNEIIFVTRVGSLPLRAGMQFERGRKAGKTHQNILVFWKGDPAMVGEIFRSVV